VLHGNYEAARDCNESLRSVLDLLRNELGEPPHGENVRSADMLVRSAEQKNCLELLTEAIRQTRNRHCTTR
jgi:hypothetical protein